MNNELIPNEIPVFEQIKKVDVNGEYWLARELSDILKYSEYSKFKPVIKKAITACRNSGQRVKDHFAGMSEMVPIGSGAKVEVEDVRLSRYACYLIVQNASSEKEVVALGQTYFAIQTRIQEIQQMEEYSKLQTEDSRRMFLRNELSEHNKHLASAAKGAGVIDPLDYAIFQNYGYKGLYGGLDRKGIQKSKGLNDKANILDHMGSTELAANLFRATQTEEQLKKENIKGKYAANDTHYKVGLKVRKAIKDIGGTMPENLPVAENIKLIEKKNKKLKP
ncbi:DNA damage-inducible protein D [Ferruginibacter sp.]|nr:DNA damage-inducible protein D [Ferruginibacter sp.]